jgi:hypothetical protein
MPRQASKVTTGNLIFKPQAVVIAPPVTATAPTGIIAPGAVSVPIPFTGDLSFTLAAPVDIVYSVEYDPTPTDVTTPLPLKPGYFKGTVTVLSDPNLPGIRDIAGLL